MKVDLSETPSQKRGSDMDDIISISDDDTKKSYVDSSKKYDTKGITVTVTLLIIALSNQFQGIKTLLEHRIFTSSKIFLIQ